MTNITAIILTKNEEVNIKRCIDSVKQITDRIVVVDSGSDDKTVEIASSMGADIYVHTPFVHYAAQFNWALQNVNVDTVWVYRIDADEYVPEELAQEILLKTKVHVDDDVNAFLMKHKLFFMGRFLTHGGAYPFVKITLFKPLYAFFENRSMGEHVVLSSGRCLTFDHDCIHYDFKDLDSWISKHNWYATREVSDYFADRSVVALYHEAERTKKIRDGLYYRLPKFLRAKLYYWYRYYLKLGFLDGQAGKMYAFFQAYWYRYLVDAKILEYEMKNEVTEKH